jgi:hypothetical protein
MLGLVRLFPIHMDWMRLKKIEKKFDLFGIKTHPIPLNPHGSRIHDHLKGHMGLKYASICVVKYLLGPHNGLNRATTRYWMLIFKI